VPQPDAVPRPRGVVGTRLGHWGLAEPRWRGGPATGVSRLHDRPALHPLEAGQSPPLSELRGMPLRKNVLVSLLFIAALMALVLPVHGKAANGLGSTGDRVTQVRYTTQTCPGALPFQTDGEPLLQVGSSMGSTAMSQQLAISCGQGKARRIRWALGLVVLASVILSAGRRATDRVVELA
jgi:hypothetical protein